MNQPLNARALPRPEPFVPGRPSRPVAVVQSTVRCVSAKLPVVAELGRLSHQPRARLAERCRLEPAGALGLALVAERRWPLLGLKRYVTLGHVTPESIAALGDDLPLSHLMLRIVDLGTFPNRRTTLPLIYASVWLVNPPPSRPAKP